MTITIKFNWKRLNRSMKYISYLNHKDQRYLLLNKTLLSKWDIRIIKMLNRNYTLMKKRKISYLKIQLNRKKTIQKMTILIGH